MHLGLYWLIEENGDLAIATFLSHDLVYSNGVHSVGNPYPISPCVPAYFEMIILIEIAGGFSR